MFSAFLSPRLYGAIALGLFIVLGWFSLTALTESPPTWFDEGVLIQVAMNQALHGAEQIQVAPGLFEPATYVTGGFSFLRPISWSFSLFGIGLFQARIVMALFIFLCAGIFFTLIYSLFGRMPALLSLLLLVTFPPLYGQGKNVLGEVPGLFFLGSFLYFLYTLEKNKYQGIWWYVAAGVTAGLCVATKPIFILLGPAIIVGIIFKHRSVTFYWKNIALSFGAFLVPMTIWFFGRYSATDSLSSVISYYANPYAITDLHAKIIENIALFFHEAAPMYFALMMLAWFVALFIRIRRHEKITLTETIVFAFALLVTTAYTRTEGWYRYFFLAEIPALVFFASSLEIAARTIFPNRRRMQVMSLSCVVVLLISIQSYQLLVGSWVAQHSTRTTTHDLQVYISTIPKDKSFFVYNTPVAVVFLPSQNYYQYLELNTAVHLGTNQLPLLERASSEYLVTNDRAWQQASSTMQRYRMIKNIDSIIIAQKR